MCHPVLNGISVDFLGYLLTSWGICLLLNSFASLPFVQAGPTTPTSTAPTPPGRTGSAMGLEAETRYVNGNYSVILYYP